MARARLTNPLVITLALAAVAGWADRAPAAAPPQAVAAPASPSKVLAQIGERKGSVSYAAFGQATWTPVGFDIIHLTAGARWTKDKRTGLLDVVAGKPTAFVFNYDKDRVDPLLSYGLVILIAP